MKTFDLPLVLPPKPVAPKVCVACKAFRAECVVPVGEASAPMCWLCAHHVVDHECPPHKAMTAECECAPELIYPGRSAPPINASALWRELYAAAGILEHSGETPQKTRLIEEINADIERLHREIQASPIFVAPRSAPVATVAQNATRRKAP